MVNSSGTTTYAWDFENRLTSITLPGSGGTVSFNYDPFGRRIVSVLRRTLTQIWLAVVFFCAWSSDRQRLFVYLLQVGLRLRINCADCGRKLPNSGENLCGTATTAQLHKAPSI